jgi:site-specific DNA recombinase
MVGGGNSTPSLRESHVDERKEPEAAIGRLQAVYDRRQDRIHATYADKLDGTIDIALFEKASASWRAEQERCMREIAWHQSADQSYLEEGARLLGLARRARSLFARQQPHEKRKLLDLVLSRELTPTFRQPFDLLAETTAIVAQSSAKYSRNPSEHQVGWGTRIRT